MGTTIKNRERQKIQWKQKRTRESCEWFCVINRQRSSRDLNTFRFARCNNPNKLAKNEGLLNCVRNNSGTERKVSVKWPKLTQINQFKQARMGTYLLCWRSTIEPHLFMASLSRPSKTVINAQMRSPVNTAQGPHFKIPNSITYNFTPLIRPLVRKLRKLKCLWHVNFIDLVI